MKTFTTLLLFSIFIPIAAFAQLDDRRSDTTEANRLLKESAVLTEKGLYDSALVKADLAKMIFEKAGLSASKGGADVLEIMGKAFTKKNNLDSALIYLQQSLTIRLKSGDSTALAAQSYVQIGMAYLENKYYDKALSYFDKAVPVQLKVFGKENLPVANSYFFIGIAYFWKLEYDKASDYFLKCIALRTKILGEAHINDLQGVYKYSDAYHYLYLSYYNNYDFEKAIEYCKKALSIHLTYYRADKMPVALDYETLAKIYKKQGDYETAMSNILKALDEVKGDSNYKVQYAQFLCRFGDIYNLKDDYDKAINVAEQALLMGDEIQDNRAWAYSILGLAYDYKKQNDTAIYYYLKQIEYFQKKYGNESDDLGESYDDLGNSYLKKKDYPKAIEAFAKSLVVSQKKFQEKGTSYLAFDYLKLSEAYYQSGQYDLAMEQTQKSVEEFKKNLSGENPRLGVHYERFAKIYEKKRDYAAAGIFFDKALAVNRYKSPDKLNQVVYLPDLIDHLADKGDFEKAWYKDGGDTAHLNQSVRSFQEAISAIEFLNTSFSSDASKAVQKNKNYHVYEKAIQSNLLLNGLDPLKARLENMFAYFEQSKAGALQAQLKETEAIRFSQIPDSLLKKERELRVGIATCDKTRQQRIDGGKSEIDSLNLFLLSQSDSLRRLLKEVKLHFEQKYPAYYRFKYEHSFVTIAGLQQKYLTPRQTLLSYFVGDSSIFAFVIRKDTVAVFDIKKDFSLDSAIGLLRRGLYGFYTTAALKRRDQLYETTADTFALAACRLYHKLLAPLQTLLTEELVIIPDGVLNYVPFEVLLTETPEDPTQFNKHRYFGADRVISYNYSATTWLEMREKIHKAEPAKPFIAFAPYYHGDSAQLSALFPYDLAMRQGFDSLKYTGEESYKAQKIMNGDVVLNKDATKPKLEQVAGNYRIIHLATHGKANDKMGDYCFLVFAQERDSSFCNSLLYARDIYNLSLNADLVVLSACETGVGELKRGEGVVSLSRAFAYAGAKSMVTTLWSVNDKSSMQIMEYFYRELKKGVSKDYALWKAKKMYLGNIKKKEEAHPFFWSAFIPIGDMAPLKN